MKVGYTRCHRLDPSGETQNALLEQAGCETIFCDESTDTIQFQSMMKSVHDGDVVYVDTIRRIARSIREFFRIMDQFQEKGVIFVSLREDFDTSTPCGMFCLTMFQALDILERETQAVGIATAKEKGKYRGRQPLQYDPLEFDKLYRQWRSGAIKQKFMAEKLGLSIPTLSRRLKEYKSLQDKGKFVRKKDAYGHTYDQFTMFDDDSGTPRK